MLNVSFNIEEIKEHFTSFTFEKCPRSDGNSKILVSKFQDNSVLKLGISDEDDYKKL